MRGFLPYKIRPKHADVALLHFDKGEIWIEQEPFPYRLLNLSDVADSCVIYADRDTIRTLLRQGLGVATMRERAVIRWEYDGRVVLPLLRDIDATLADICLWRDWLEAEGAGIGSRSGSAVKLLRATLKAGFDYKGDQPPLTEIVGGRLHATAPRMYPDIEVWDLRSAYASTLANLPSGTWRRNGKTLIENSDSIGIMEATIFIPERGIVGPLPQRDGIATVNQWWEEWMIERPYPQRATLTGIWSADEIRSALEHGASIRKIHRSWVLRVEDYPFQSWWEAVERGRRMPGAAGSLAKITGNTLWGIFATRSGPLHSVYYVDGKPTRTPIKSKPLFHRNYPLAELITAKVRSRVYNELIIPAGERLISVCVDGGLVAPGFTPVASDWRLKDRGKLCGFLSPYLLMYSRNDGTTEYKAAGIPKAKRAAFFRSLQSHAQRHGRIALKMRNALEGSSLDMALAEDAISQAFA